MRLKSHLQYKCPILLLLIDSNSPATARNVYVRAERHNIDAALWNIGIVRAEHIQIKSVLGIGGQRGIRGRFASSPPVPLDEKKRNESLEKLLLSLRGKAEAIKRLERSLGILCLLIATLVTLARNDTWKLVMLSVSETSLWIPRFILYRHISLRFHMCRFSRGTRGTTYEAFPLSPFDPQTPARS